MIITIFIDRYYSYKKWKNFEDILSSRKKKKRKNLFIQTSSVHSSRKARLQITSSFKAPQCFA